MVDTWRAPSDAAIEEMLARRLAEDGVGIVAGVIDAGGRRVIAAGERAAGGGRAPDGTTVFEIGSITKAFTGLLLADMDTRGEAGLDDPVDELLPPGVTAPTRGGRRITLADLATHTSGLPRLPDNMAPRDPGNPYADYTVAQLHAFLSGHELRREIGRAHIYSNLGAGLLGHALATRAGRDFEALVRARITGPLGMESTAIALSPDMAARLAPGHDEAGRPVGAWDLPTLAGAGGLRSTADDLMILLSAALGFEATPLAAAMAAQIAPRRPTETEDLQALGWVITPVDGGEIVRHSGGTGGYRSFIGFDRARGVGVVVLTNAATSRGGDDIGLHLLTGRPLARPPVARTAIPLETDVLDRWVGRYRMSPTAEAVVARRGETLFLKLPGRGAIPMHAESETAFSLEGFDAQVIFTPGADGRASGFIARQNGRDRPAERVE